MHGYFGLSGVECVDRDMYSARLCLLEPSGVEDIMKRREEYVDIRGLSHRHTVRWDLGVADSEVLTVCYDCLCLISLFRPVMYLSYDWDDVFVWTGHDEEYDRSPGWELRYLPHLYWPLVVDRVTEYLTEIKVPGWSLVLSGDMYTGAQRCVCTRGTLLGVSSTGRISSTLIGRRASVGGSVGWSCVDCAVDISPGGVWIDYIRPGLEDGTLIDATPVTGSLVSSTLFSCRDMFCTAGFSSNRTFCGTDWVLPAGYQVFWQWIAERWTMAASGVSVVDDRAGITFGVELYVPWDAPEAVVDVSSAEFAVSGGISQCCGCLASNVQTHRQAPAASPGHGVACAERSDPHGAGPAGCSGGSGALAVSGSVRRGWSLSVANMGFISLYQRGL